MNTKNQKKSPEVQKTKTIVLKENSFNAIGQAFQVKNNIGMQYNEASRKLNDVLLVAIESAGIQVSDVAKIDLGQNSDLIVTLK